jgi:hypothetical protein
MYLLQTSSLKKAGCFQPLIGQQPPRFPSRVRFEKGQAIGVPAQRNSEFAKRSAVFCSGPPKVPGSPIRSHSLREEHVGSTVNTWVSVAHGNGPVASPLKFQARTH